jgi:hypothetical protein
MIFLYPLIYPTQFEEKRCSVKTDNQRLTRDIDRYHIKT